MPKFHLLTTANGKTMKGEGRGYKTFILHLAPAKLSGYNACPMASKGCAAGCLNTAGRGGMFKAGTNTNHIQKARIRKTKEFFEIRGSFMYQLANDIARAIKWSEKNDFIPVFRLNGTSDIRWETIPVAGAKNIMTLFPDVIFYDYTKIANRKNLPANYTLTFSRNEENDLLARGALANGLNVAVVFRTKELPTHYYGVPVVNGDNTDLRFLDPRNVVVGLVAKGRAKKDTSGFVVDL